MADFIPYDLFDAESGLVWRILVTEAEANTYNLDHVARYRKIKALKGANIPPYGAWDSSSNVSTALETTNVVSQELPLVNPPASTSTVQRAQGPKGADWRGKGPECFLNACLPYRKWLRSDVVPSTLWQTISDDMFTKQKLDYSWEQLRAKIKTLKRTFKGAKEGKHGHEKWPHFWTMTYIFDDPITAGDVTLAPEGFEIACGMSERGGRSKPKAAEAVLIELDMGEPLFSSTFVAPDTTETTVTGDSQVVELAEGVASTSLPNSGLNYSGHVDLLENEHFTNNNVDKHSSMDILTIVTSAIDLKDTTETTVTGDSQVVELAEGVASTSLPNSGLNYSGDGDLENEHFTNNNVDNHHVKNILPVVSSAIGLKVTNGTDALADDAVWRSPAKKKTKAANGAKGILLTPRKSPNKRKVAKYKLQLTDDETEKLLKECLAKKETLQLDKIPQKVWKDISDALGGGNFTWQLCKDKFLQMDTAFQNTFLPLEGIMGGVMWPYFKSFCDLYDIPANYASVLDASADGEMEDDSDDDDDDEAEEGPLLSTENAVVNRGSKLWPHDVILLLLSLYKPRKHLLEGGSYLRHNILYSQIAEGLKEKGYKRSWKQCKSKISRMKSMFLTECQNANKTGNPPSKWPYFTQMSEIHLGSAAVIAPVVLSSGRGIQYKEDGVLQEMNRSGTRTRPNQTHTKKEQKVKKPVFKNWQHEAHETNVRQRDELVKQVERMNTQLEKSAVRRDEFYTAYMNKYLK